MGWKKITTLGDMKVDSDPTDATDFASADVLFNHINGKLWFLKNDSTSMWSLTLDTDLDHIDQTNLNLQLVGGSFTDGLGSAIDRLIGGGDWFAIEGLTFGVEYINGPPTSVTIEEIGAEPDLTILDAGTNAQDVSDAPKNLVAIPYPARLETAGNTHLYGPVQFKITVTGPGGPFNQTEGTSHNKFYNQIRYGITDSLTIGQTEITNDLTSTDWLKNVNDSAGTRSFTPGASGDNFIALAVPVTGVSTLHNNGFLYDGYTMDMNSPGMVNFTNTAGHQEYFNVYRSLLDNMGNGDLEAFTSEPDVINHHFVGVTESAVGSIDPEEGLDLEHDTLLNIIGTWGSINVGVGKYAFLSYDDDVHGVIANGTTTAFRIDGITAGFETDTVSYQNAQGYTTNFRNYKCLASNTGNEEITTTGGTTVINKVHWGAIDTINTANVNALGDSDTANDVHRADGTFDTGNVTGGKALCLAYSPAHISTAEITDTRMFRVGEGTGTAVTAQFTKTTLTHTNLYGYEETYHVWKADTVDTGTANFYTYNGTTLRYHYFAGGTSSAVGAIVPLIGDSRGTTTGLAEERDWGNISTGSDYAYVAYDDEAGIINYYNSTGFRINDVTAKFIDDTHAYVNPYDYSSTYYFYRCVVSNLGTVGIKSNGGSDWSDYIHVGVTQDVVNTSVDDDTINNDLTVTTLLDEALSTTVLDMNFSPGDASTNEFVTIAFPDLANPQPTVDHFRMNDITAGFTKISTEIEHTNIYGYEHDYEVWQCNIADTGDFTLRMSSSYTTKKNHSYIGVSSNAASAVNIPADLEAINAQQGNSFADTVKDNLAVADAEYIWFAYPARYGDPLATDFRLEDLTAGFSLDGSYVVTNEFGYSESYDLWISDQPGTNLIAAPDFEVDNGFSNVPQNHQMHGGLDVATYNQAFLDSLVAVSATISNDVSQTATTGRACTATASNYTYMAFPSRLNIDAGKFRYEQTDGDELQAGFTKAATDFNYRNQAGYEEDYDLFKSDVQDLPNGKIGWGQSLQQLTRFMGLVDPAGTDVLTEAEVETLLSHDYVSTSTTNHVKTWGTVTPTTGQHIAIAVPTNCNDLDVGTDYEADGNVGTEFTILSSLSELTQTAGFVKQSDLSITNEYGFQKDYDIYLSKHPDIGDGTVTLTTHSSKQLKAHMYIGYSTDTSADDNAFGVASFPNTWAEIETTVAISGTTSSDKYDTYTLTVDESTYYIWYIYPKRLGLVEAFYFSTAGGFEGGMLAAATISLCNEAGWTEDYYAYRSENPGISEDTEITLQAASS